MKSCIGRISNKFLRVFQKKAGILLYHRVAEDVLDPQLLCVSPANFARQMEYLRQHYQPITLRRLGECLIRRDIPERSVVITFDDGYADNLTQALPVLRQFDIAATVFITAGYLGETESFILGALGHCLLEPRILPESLELTISGKKYSWAINIHKDYSGPWNVTMGSDPSLRHSCYRQLHSLLRPLDYRSRQAVLGDLCRWAGYSGPAGSGSSRQLSIDELMILDKEPLIEIGAHGARHLLLARQSQQGQWQEIMQGKQRLEKLLSHPVDSFAYPYGGPDAVAPDTIELVKKAGFKLACANFTEPVTKNSNLFFLPRFLVRNWDDQEFAKHIKRACGG